MILPYLLHRLFKFGLTYWQILFYFLYLFFLLVEVLNFLIQKHFLISILQKFEDIFRFSLLIYLSFFQVFVSSIWWAIRSFLPPQVLSTVLIFIFPRAAFYLYLAETIVSTLYFCVCVWEQKWKTFEISTRWGSLCWPLLASNISQHLCCCFY